MTNKTRLDVSLVELGLAASRHKAQALILAGHVLVSGNVQSKPDFSVTPDQILTLKEKEKFVSRGGIKMQGALDTLGVKPAGKFVLDVGASTGGFTDCLLQNGAVHVTAVDVGYGQIAESLRKDMRVSLMDRVNARYLKPQDFSRQFDLATVDVSFISLEIILPAIVPLLKPGGEILALIKPQFEAGRAQVKKGVVRDTAVHEAVVEKISHVLEALGCSVLGVSPSPIQGPKGNIEFFIFALTAITSA